MTGVVKSAVKTITHVCRIGADLHVHEYIIMSLYSSFVLWSPPSILGLMCTALACHMTSVT